MKNSRLLEICVDSPKGAIAAEKGGASRIELCSQLNLDGLTPSVQHLKEICATIKIPIVAMIRPEPTLLLGNREFTRIRKEIDALKEYRLAGFVLGGVNKKNEIPYELIKKLVQACAPKPVTFHRAFDLVKDKIYAMKSLEDIGVKRLLTSGGQGGAINNLKNLQALVDQATVIEIIAAGGIRENNLGQIIQCGAPAYHSGLDRMPTKEKVARLKHFL